MADHDLLHAPDGLLAERAVDGDVRAFEVLLRRHSPLMRAYATRLTRSSADADDVVQEAFIVAWNNLDTLGDGAAVRAWLMRIVSNKAIDRIRARRRDTPLDDWDVAEPMDAGPEHQAEVHSQLTAVGRILSTLPELQRQCWLLKESGGYSYQEIADELGAPVSTVRGALSRARRTLIRGMKDWT